MRDSGIVVETQGEEDLQKLIDNPELKENGFTVEKPGKRRPKLIVYDVPKSMSEDELLEAIYDQNEETVGAEETQFREKFKLAFKVNSLTGSQIWDIIWDAQAASSSDGIPAASKTSLDSADVTSVRITDTSPKTVYKRKIRVATVEQMVTEHETARRKTNQESVYCVREH